MTDTFLSDAELKALTGCTAKKLQVENLRQNGVQFTLNRKGKPVVPRSAIERVSRAGVATETKSTTWSPRVLKLG